MKDDAGNRSDLNRAEDTLRRSLDETERASRALVSALGEARRAMSMIASLSAAVGVDRAAVVDAGGRAHQLGIGIGFGGARMTALLEGPPPGDGLDARWFEARAKVAALEAEAAAAARDGRPVDAAALAQARAEAEALGGALALDADEDRERAARAEAERIAGHKAAARRFLAEFLDMVDEAEAQARGMVAAMKRAEACRAALQRELGALDAKVLYEQSSLQIGLGNALSGALMPFVGEDRHFGRVTLPATRDPSAWRGQFSWVRNEITRHIGDEHG